MFVRLSVAIPTFQHGRALRELLDSLYANGSDLFEVVVSNNASTDETAAVLALYSTAYPNLRVLTQAETVPFDENLARAIEACTGDYVWTLSSDDLVRPGAVRAILDAADTASGSILLCNWWLGDSQATPLRLRRGDPTDRTFVDRAGKFASLTPDGMFMCALVLPNVDLRNLLPMFRNGQGLIHWQMAMYLAAAGVPVRVLSAAVVSQRQERKAPYYDVAEVYGVGVRSVLRLIEGQFGVTRRETKRVEVLLIRRLLLRSVGAARRFWPDAARRWFPDLVRVYGRHPAFWALIVPLYLAPSPLLRLVGKVAIRIRGGRASGER